jgi:small subunit ribosomal protein S20
VANTKQSTKRARQTLKREARNASQRTAIRSSIKKVLKVFQAKDLKAAQDAFKKTVSVIDKAVTHHIIHRNKASRLKSRLHTKLKNIA